MSPSTFVVQSRPLHIQHPSIQTRVVRDSGNALSGDFVTTPPSIVHVPFHLVDGLIVIDGVVNGQTGFWVLTTGGPILALNAKRVTLPAENVATANLGNVQQLQWGPIAMRDVPATSIDFHVTEEHVRTSSPALRASPMLGFLGVPQLEPFTTIIDYDNEELTLVLLDRAGNPLAPLPGSRPIAQLPLVMSNGTPFVRAIVADTIRGLFQLNTGNNGKVMLEESFAKRVKQSIQRATHHAPDGDTTTVGDELCGFVWGPISIGRMPVTVTTLRLEMHEGKLGFGFMRAFRIGLNFRNPGATVWARTGSALIEGERVLRPTP